MSLLSDNCHGRLITDEARLALMTLTALMGAVSTVSKAHGQQ